VMWSMLLGSIMVKVPPHRKRYLGCIPLAVSHHNNTLITLS